MKQFIGVKQINAMPMTRGEWCEFRGCTVPDNENPSDEGYLANTADFKGYVMTFGMAIEALKKGLSVSRKGWNGKGMWLFIIQGSNDIAKLHGYGFGEMLNEPTFRDAIFMKTVDNQLVPWTASQTDMLSEDWCVVSNG